MRGLAVAAGEGVGEGLGAHAVDGAHVVAAGRAGRQGGEQAGTTAGGGSGMLHHSNATCPEPALHSWLSCPAGCLADLHQPHPRLRASRAAPAHLLAMAALRASTGHIGSLSSPTVAEGLNTTSAPLSPKPCQFMGWCLQHAGVAGGSWVSQHPAPAGAGMQWSVAAAWWLIPACGAGARSLTCRSRC